MSSGLRAKTPLLLLVDDDVDERKLFAGYLRYAGFHVEVARDGTEALEKVLAFVPTLILMDMEMPVMDGWEATKRLKSDPRTSAIPIVALSAQVEAADARALPFGCDAVIAKPCAPEQLVTLVLRTLSETRKVSAQGS